MTIYSSLRNISLDEVEVQFSGKGYGEFKNAVSESIIDEFVPIQKKFNQIIDNEDYIFEQFRINSEKAREIACEKLRSVKEKIGFIY